MTTELTLLIWTLLLALVQVLLPTPFRTAETGVAYNTGARDEPGPPIGRLTGRLQRAQANLFETLPIFASAILVAHVAGREGTQTLWGASLYLGARVVYVPLYGFGVPVLRTLAWSVSLLGLLMVMLATLRPG